MNEFDCLRMATFFKCIAVVFGVFAMLSVLSIIIR